ncbi:MAG: pyruvate formate-lyase, partial [Erysipelotrichaceae bacterium]|nr:pyruvate formate-lyase [Erysipelotrichaceae bacterium]
MAHINIEGAQNVNVSKRIPVEKSPMEQLEIMEEYTKVHRQHQNEDKAYREIACLEVLFPTLFRHPQPGDWIAGRLDFLPIGFGSVTSIGGVGHYCVFHELRNLQKELPQSCKHRIDALYDYWQQHDVKTIYCQDV